MIKYIKVNKKYKFYIYKAKEKKNLISKLFDNIKPYLYYLYYYMSLIFYGNLYYFIVLLKF